MPLFDPRPKRSIKEFFNREDELSLFTRYVRSSPLTLVLGLRRYGKTSLILTGLNSLGIKYLYIDCKALPSGVFGLSDFITLFTQSLNEFMSRYGTLKERLLKLLSGIKGLRLGPLGVIINTRKFEPSGLIDVLHSLNEVNEGIVLVIDEAQELRRMVRYRFDSIVAYAYDNLSNLHIVLSGSQVGLLYRFLRLNDPNSPLYGRAYTEVRLGRLSNELSKEFLIKGYREYGIEAPEELINYIVDAVDGVIGWLTYIGFTTAESGSLCREVINEAINKAYQLALKELSNYLSIRGLARARYVEILKVIASGEGMSWSEIYSLVSRSLGKVPKPVFSKLLKNLLDAGFIEKRGSYYYVADPILGKAVLKYGFKLK